MKLDTSLFLHSICGSCSAILFFKLYYFKLYLFYVRMYIIHSKKIKTSHKLGSVIGDTTSSISSSVDIDTTTGFIKSPTTGLINSNVTTNMATLTQQRKKHKANAANPLSSLKPDMVRVIT